MLAASHLTVGSVLEEQARPAPGTGAAVDPVPLDHHAAFEAGLALILSGLVQQTDEPAEQRG